MKTSTIIKRTKKLFHSNIRIHNEITIESTQEVWHSMKHKNKIKIEEERREKEIRPP